MNTDNNNCSLQGSSSVANPDNLRYYLAVELFASSIQIARFQYWMHEDIVDAVKAELEKKQLYSAIITSSLARMIHGHICTSIKECYGPITINYIKGVS